MKNLLLLSFLLLACTGFGQHIKKKLLGTYEGAIPAYTMDVGQGVVEVFQTTIIIELTENGVVQQLGNMKRKGTWKITETDKQYYILVLQLDGQLAEERIILYKKGHTMKREGIFPQPDATLILKR